MREGAAHIHAAMCELVELTVAYQRTGYWDDWTNRSYAHWLSVCAGFGLHSGRELIRIGEAVETMPAIRAGFACGELS